MTDEPGIGGPALPWYINDLLMAPINSACSLIEAVRPGLEYQVARTATHTEPEAPVTMIEPGPPPSDRALRVAAALTGLWADQEAPGCKSDLGEHATDCPHRERWMTTSYRAIAREAFGADGQSQRRMVHRALDELASRATRVMVFDPQQRRVIGGAVATVGEFRWLGDALRWSWATSTHERLLQGAYQRLPPGIVQHLSGAAFHVWREVICHPGVARLRVGQSWELAVTGPSPSLRLVRLGLGSVNRPAKVRAALERAARRGNEVQWEWVMEVIDRAADGVKLRVRRGADRGRDRRISRTPVAQIEDAIPIKTRCPDGFQTDLQTETEGTDRHSWETDRPAWSRPSLTVDSRDEVERIVRRLEACWGPGHPVSPKQRALISGIETRGRRARCDIDHYDVVNEAACVIEAGGWRVDLYLDRPDPLEALRLHDLDCHPHHVRLDERPVPDVDVDDALLAALPTEVAVRARELLLAGHPAEQVADELGLSLLTYRADGRQVLLEVVE